MTRHEGEGNRVVERSTLKHKMYEIVISHINRHFVYQGIKNVTKLIQ